MGQTRYAAGTSRLLRYQDPLSYEAERRKVILLLYADLGSAALPTRASYLMQQSGIDVYACSVVFYSYISHPKSFK